MMTPRAPSARAQFQREQSSPYSDDDLSPHAPRRKPHEPISGYVPGFHAAGSREGVISQLCSHIAHFGNARRGSLQPGRRHLYEQRRIVLLAHAPGRDWPSPPPSRPVPRPVRARERVARGSPPRPKRHPGRSGRGAGDAEQAERGFLRLLAAELDGMTGSDPIARDALIQEFLKVISSDESITELSGI